MPICRKPAKQSKQSKKPVIQEPVIQAPVQVKRQSKRTELGVVDGHFWVELQDGTVVDNYFPQYDFIKRFNRCEGEMLHYPAPQDVQEELLDLLAKKFKNRKYSSQDLAGFVPLFNNCDRNAVLAQKVFGGKIVFGSMGWKKIGSDKVHWEYGGADWVRAEQFYK